MSPYLFVIAMEYLQRELAQLAKNRNFKFYPRCKKLGVIHICFTDDMLMFCKADITSIILLQQTFLKFSNSFGLQANAKKSSIYLVGISSSTKQDIIQELDTLKVLYHLDTQVYHQLPRSCLSSNAGHQQRKLHKKSTAGHPNCFHMLVGYN